MFKEARQHREKRSQSLNKEDWWLFRLSGYLLEVLVVLGVLKHQDSQHHPDKQREINSEKGQGCKGMNNVISPYDRMNKKNQVLKKETL